MLQTLPTLRMFRPLRPFPLLDLRPAYPTQALRPSQRHPLAPLQTHRKNHRKFRNSVTRTELSAKKMGGLSSARNFSAVGWLLLAAIQLLATVICGQLFL